jgi:ABC-type phosphate transport system substrate-binding protein
MASRRRKWLWARLTVYVAVIAVLLVVRGGLDLSRLKGLLRTGSESASLVISGRDLAPHLLDRLIDTYGADYPGLEVSVRGGGTNRALEDLINRRADVALLYRRPDETEQRLFREADGDTATVVPVALGGILLLDASEAGPAVATREQWRDRIAGRDTASAPTLYAPDPNGGLWTAFLTALGLETPPQTPAGIVFLPGADDVIAAVRGDGALGLASTLTVPADLAVAGVLAVAWRETDAAAAVTPTREAIAEGSYGLHHRLYAACRAGGGLQAAKFLTHLASARGQRQVERAGYLPDSRVLREIILTRKPVGG